MVWADLAHAERAQGVPTAAFSRVFNDPRSRFTGQKHRLAANLHPQVSPRWPTGPYPQRATSAWATMVATATAHHQPRCGYRAGNGGAVSG